MAILDNFYSKRTPLILIIALILIGSSITTNIIELKTTREMLRNKIISEELPTISKMIHNDIKLDIMAPVIASRRMANDMFLKEWVKGNQTNKQELIEYLKTIKDEFNALTAFLVSEKTQKYYNSNGNVYQETRECPAAAWYFDFRESEKSLDLNATLDIDQENMPTIFINCKISDNNNNFIGATGLGIQLQTIPRVLAEYEKIFNRNIYFVNAEGKIIATSNNVQNNINKFRQLPEISQRIDKILNNKLNYFQYNQAGKTMLVNIHYIKELNWWLFIEQTETNALNLVDSVLFMRSLINFGSIILTMLLITLTINYFHKQLNQLATTDKLTGVHNRQVFDYSLKQSIEKFKRNKIPFSLMLLDIDHFKNINDTLGHLEGDKILKQIAQLIQKNIRSSDELCRWGGEEFIIITHECKLTQAAKLAEKLRHIIEITTLSTSSNISTITISIGIAQMEPTDNDTTLVSKADKALYQAKNSGRNCIKLEDTTNLSNYKTPEQP